MRGCTHKLVLTADRGQKAQEIKDAALDIVHASDNGSDTKDAGTTPIFTHLQSQIKPRNATTADGNDASARAYQGHDHILLDQFAH